jgi:hypothetical protein
VKHGPQRSQQRMRPLMVGIAVALSLTKNRRTMPAFGASVGDADDSSLGKRDEI